MLSDELRGRLVDLAHDVHVPLSPGIIESLATYLNLLSEWNAAINLTSLQVQPPSDEALRRLVLEPLEAAQYIQEATPRWLDIGSGGGSPAIPLKLARPNLVLTMVESRTRKAAFLREVIRLLRLVDTTVRDERLQDLARRDEFQHRVTLVTLRAVKLDLGIVESLSRLIAPDGELLVFSAAVQDLPGFSHVASTPLLASPGSQLFRYHPMFHVKQSG